jgi:Ca-activated chloride channel family protein
MNFGHPHAFWLLIVVAVGALLDRVKRDQRQMACPRIPRLRAEATSIDFSPQSNQRGLRWRLWLGCALLVVALAGPRAGFVREDDVKNSREVVLAIDLSRSMLAKDVKPSRLDHVKLLTSALISKSAGDRFGLLLFSASAYVQLPLSNDYDILADMLPNLSPDYFPLSGTNYGAMLKSALTTFSTTGDAERFLVVLSDGEAWDKEWKTSIEELKKRNIHVVGLGVGTPGGGLIPDGNRAVRDANGLEVLTRLEPATLQELATATGGSYQRADTYVDITTLLKSTAPVAADGANAKVDQTRLVERYRWALLPALVLLALSFWRDFPVHPSMRKVNLPPTRSPASAKTSAQAGALAATAALVVFAFLVTPRLHSQDLSEEDAKNSDQKEADAGSPMAMTAKLVSQRISGMLASRAPNANDCVSLVIDIVNYCEQMLRGRLRFPVSIIDDAQHAVDWGEKLDPQGGDWTKLRKTLDDLLKADTEPWKTARPDAAGKVAMRPGYDPGSEMKDDRRASRGGPVEEVVNAADLALPLLKLEQVRRQDQPARLFQMLEGKARQLPPANMPQW